MGKGKNSKGAVSKHSQARIDHLHHIAQYLTEQALSASDDARPQPELHLSPPHSASNGSIPQSGPNHSSMASTPADATASTLNDSSIIPHPSFPGLPNLYTTHLLSIARKSQLRLSSHVKHSICKRCSSPLLPGLTSTSRTENLSRGGAKPWADVQVAECLTCGAGRRVPVGARRQMGRGKRGDADGMEGAKTILGKRVKVRVGDREGSTANGAVAK